MASAQKQSQDKPKEVPQNGETKEVMEKAQTTEVAGDNPLQSSFGLQIVHGTDKVTPAGKRVPEGTEEPQVIALGSTK